MRVLDHCFPTLCRVAYHLVEHVVHQCPSVGCYEERIGIIYLSLVDNIYIYIPESSKGVRFVPHQKQTLLGLKFDTLVGPSRVYIYIYIHTTHTWKCITLRVWFPERGITMPRSEVISMTSAVTAMGDSSQWQCSTGVMVLGWWFTVGFGVFFVNGCWTQNRGENPKNGWFIMENWLKWMIWGVPLFLETPKWRNLYFTWWFSDGIVLQFDLGLGILLNCPRCSNLRTD